jgi:mannose-6-phosphate isomerase-like protein (cupin superfamily)
MDIRRVVTGHDEQGKAVFVSDELVPPITLSLIPGYDFHRLCGADQTLSFPDDGFPPEGERYFPPVGGFRFAFFTIPPDRQVELPPDINVYVGAAELKKKLPGMAEHAEVDNPGMHTTDTVDYGVVLSGQATLELDDGATTTLGPGDSYIQNGTRHRWSNSGEDPAVVAITLIGAHRRGVD